MYIPEWEVEESIAWNPDLIGASFDVQGLKLVERQKYLKKLGRYIDILFKNQDRYIIVEVKCNQIDDTSVVTNQVLEYKKGLAKELRIPEEKIICILATPGGFSENVKKLCDSSGVLTAEIDENEIINIIPKLEESKLSLISDHRKTLFQKILQKRGIFVSSEEISDGVLEEIKSVRTWIKYGTHDELTKRKIADLFKEISENAPICAHEVGLATKGKLIENQDIWFWLFYSVMDRRSNAANFIKARRVLEMDNLFSPQNIVKRIDNKGYEETISTISKILILGEFPLMHDSNIGHLAQPKSIVDAAKFMSKHDYDFDKLYDQHFKNAKGDYDATYKSLRKDLQDNIYGVGPRISSQFIRGMVLKGNWRLPLKDDLLLEKCQFNIRFAGKLRLSLIEDEESYYQELGKFADRYLDGNRAIISHVLWYTRKRYCDKKIMCNKCKLAGYCMHYQKTVLEPTVNANSTLESYF